MADVSKSSSMGAGGLWAITTKISDSAPNGLTRMRIRNALEVPNERKISKNCRLCATFKRYSMQICRLKTMQTTNLFRLSLYAYADRMELGTLILSNGWRMYKRQVTLIVRMDF